MPDGALVMSSSAVGVRSSALFFPILRMARSDRHLGNDTIGARLKKLDVQGLVQTSLLEQSAVATVHVLSGS